MFIDNLEKLCRAKNLEMNTAVVKAGMSSGLSSNWKRNGTIPKYHQLVALTKVLDCKVADFFVDFQEDSWKMGDTDYRITVTKDGTDLSNLLFMYQNCTKAQRARFMSMMYDFEDKVLNP